MIAEKKSDQIFYGQNYFEAGQKFAWIEKKIPMMAYDDV